MGDWCCIYHQSHCEFIIQPDIFRNEKYFFSNTRYFDRMGDNSFAIFSHLANIKNYRSTTDPIFSLGDDSINDTVDGIY